MPTNATQIFGGGGAAIYGYTQSSLYQTSQAIAIPAGTKYIQALLGGGGAGGKGGGGGSGAIQIFEIPVVGTTLDLVVGAGGAANVDGGTTTVSIDGTLYAAAGGGNTGKFGANASGASAGVGVGRPGGAPFPGRLLWSACDIAASNGNLPGSGIYLDSGTTGVPTFAPLGMAGYGLNIGCAGAAAANGWGSGSNYTAGTNQSGRAGGPGSGGSPPTGTGTNGGAGTFGGGGAQGTTTGGSGGSLAALTIWGYTGFAGGTGATAGGGGGGLFAAGTDASGSTGGNGGNGSGGGGGGTGGAGGNGFGVFRFFS